MTEEALFNVHCVIISTLCERRPKAYTQKADQDPCSASWVEALIAGINTPLLTISKQPRPIPFRIVFEKIDGEQSFQFAAAEVVRIYFAKWFEIEPKAELMLYVGGTNAIFGENNRAT